MLVAIHFVLKTNYLEKRKYLSSKFNAFTGFILQYIKFQTYGTHLKLY